MKDKIFLGFEVGTGEEVYIEPSHLVVTGVTQRSGKTTTLQALIKRGGCRAVIFSTKVGEKGITEGRPVPPFFRERSDWQYVQSLLEATVRERLKFERSWIIDLCKNAHSLQEIKNRLDKALETGRFRNRKISSLTRNVFIALQAYFELVIPQLRRAEFSDTLELYDGVNIMDLEYFSDEIQSLVIRSVLEEILNNHREVIVVLPEAWKMLPQGRGSPCKQVAEAFIRQGAANKNFLWLDSQDVTGTDKTHLKQISTWIMGIQLEKNEVIRTLDQMPLPKSQKPPPDEIMTLKVGHFFLCTPEETRKVYVQPAWLSAEEARRVALGEVSVDSVTESITPPLDIDEGKIMEAVMTQIRPILEKIKADILRDVMRKIHETKRYDVAPLAKIQKDFLNDTKNKILDDISRLTEGQKKILKFVEAKGSGTNVSEILDRGFGLNITSQRNRRMVLDGCRGLKYLNLIRMDENNRIYPFLRDRIADRLQFYGASEKEIDLVYKHVMANLAE